jgi:prepilin-type N-terminal cleavage/methylation domain-containing protein
MKSKKGFTLIELLVVIAIIALLLSILMPSLSKVKDIAKNTICQTNQRSVFQALATYAAGNDNRCPERPVGVKFNHLQLLDWDLRDTLRPYLGDKMEVFNDPFCKSGVDLGHAVKTMAVEGNYGYTAGVSLSPNQKSKRFGEPLEYEGRKYYIVSMDMLIIGMSTEYTQSGHPGRGSEMSLTIRDDSEYSYARYEVVGSNNFGTQKLNYVYTDGSIKSFKFDFENVFDSSTRSIKGLPLKAVPLFDGGAKADLWRVFMPVGR